MTKTMLAAGCIAMLLAAGCSPQDPASLVVARVEDRKITVGDFEAAVRTMEARYLPETDDLDGKKEFLRHLINKEVMVLKALAMGYPKDEPFIQEWESFRGPFLVASLERVATRGNRVSDEEVESYYQHMHNAYTISQIILADESEAMALRERILAGADFAEMARKYSLAKAAGRSDQRGIMSIGTMHWWVEDALLDMEAGDLSMPLRTPSGYSLVKVHSKSRTVPDRDKEWVKRRLLAIKNRKSMEDLKAKIEKDIGLQFFSEAVSIAFDALPDPDIPYQDIISYKITRANAPKLNLAPQHRDMLICQYKDGHFSLADFERVYEATAPHVRPRRENGKLNIVQTVHMQVFDKILPDYAEQVAKLLDDPEVRKTHDNNFERLLIQRLYKDQIIDRISVTDRDVLEFYEENREQLAVPEQRDFSLLIVADEEVALDIHRQATAKNFDGLARKYSRDEKVADNLGRTGLHRRGDMPEYDEAAFALTEVGSITEPFRTSRGWAIAKLDEIKEGYIPEFEQARETLRQHVLGMKGEEFFEEMIEKWRAEYSVEIKEKNLAKARLTRLRP